MLSSIVIFGGPPLLPEPKLPRSPAAVPRVAARSGGGVAAGVDVVDVKARSLALRLVVASIVAFRAESDLAWAEGWLGRSSASLRRREP
jgi:hypothetical protein